MAKTVLVTGTSTGIGAACVGRLARSGWTVYAGVRREADGDAVVARTVGDVRPLLLDVTDVAQVAGAVERLRRELGSAGLDGLVNNAGIGVGGPVEYLPDADWQRVFDVNVFAPIRLTRELFPLVDVASGRFVFIGSMAGRAAAPYLAPYSASKHALEALAESMRHELRHTSMRVALIEPGEIRTAIFDKADAETARIDALLDEAGRQRYGEALDMGRGFAEHGRTRGSNAGKVADAVEHALTARRPKARYLVGRDAKLVGAVTRLLPDTARDALVRLQFRNYARIGARRRRSAT